MVLATDGDSIGKNDSRYLLLFESLARVVVSFAVCM
jgi:hypothetical protein